MNSTLTYIMVIMLLVNPFNFWPMPPYDYALIASVSLVFGVGVMFFWRRAELNRLKGEVDRLLALCHEMEDVIEMQSEKLAKTTEIKEGLEDALEIQKTRTAELLDKTNFMYVAMLKNGTLKREDLKWLADQEIENIMKLFDKK